MAFWRKKKPTPKPIAAPVDVAPKQIKISYEALARAKHRDSHPPVLFATAIHPPMATPSKMMIAQDSSIGSSQDWANGQMAATYGDMWSEGLTFLGFAYLAELAQRPEYRVMSETIASEMTRKWIRFTSTSDDDDDKAQRIKELSAEFDRLDVAGMFRTGAEKDGYFGRGHIYIDTGDGNDPDELKQSIGDGRDSISKSKIGIGSIKALRNVEALWCYPTGYNSTNPLADNWYRPDAWFVMNRTVHSSRMITLIGREVPDILKPTYSFGGLSMSQMAKPYVDNWLQTRQSVTDIIESFTTWVLKTDLSTTMQADGDELFKRLSLFNLLRSNQGVMAINKDTEDFANVSAPLAGLGELKSLAQQDMASVSHIPLVKLTGITPSGLNSSTEGELVVFYDWIGSYQEKLFRRPLHRLMGLIMLSLWGEVDDDIGFEFEPLWSLDEAEAATAEKTRADTDVAYIESGVLSAEEVRQRLAADDHSGYTSIDVDDAPDLLDEEEQGLEPAGGRPDPSVTGDPGGDPGAGSGSGTDE
jgi:phage-related protein (TIGR01555 family)